jgi:hypothetical protein
MYYCRDNGDPATIEDDLPSLNITVPNTPSSSPILLKEFLFPSASHNPLEQGAVGIRVVPNDNHFSPAYWYDRFFTGPQKGATSPLIVDGYQAAQDGRTVYVNAANLYNADIHGNKNIYTNIYLISYSEGASDKIIGIYDQLLNNFHFNVGTSTDPDIGTYSTCSNDNGAYCLTDTDCPAGAGYCHSDKAQLTRDVKRLADLQTINVLLDNYYNLKRCSNNRNRSCQRDGNCSNDGQCDNFYPTIESGSYVSAHTFSTWPSWQATLGENLNNSLPVDPLNQMIACNRAGYEASTCWSEAAKAVMCPTISAQVYSYQAATTTVLPTLLAAMPEYSSTTSNWQPDWSKVEFLRFNPWRRLVSGSSGIMNGTCSP